MLGDLPSYTLLSVFISNRIKTTRGEGNNLSGITMMSRNSDRVLRLVSFRKNVEEKGRHCLVVY